MVLGGVAGMVPGEVAGMVLGGVAGMVPGEAAGMVPGEAVGMVPGGVAGMVPAAKIRGVRPRPRTQPRDGAKPGNRTANFHGQSVLQRLPLFLQRMVRSPAARNPAKANRNGVLPVNVPPS